MVSPVIVFQIPFIPLPTILVTSQTDLKFAINNWIASTTAAIATTTVPISIAPIVLKASPAPDRIGFKLDKEFLIESIAGFIPAKACFVKP